MSVYRMPAALIPRAELVVDRVHVRRRLSQVHGLNELLEAAAERLLAPSVNVFITELKANFGATSLLVLPLAGLAGDLEPEVRRRITNALRACRDEERSIEDRWAPLLTRPLRCLLCGRWGYHLAGCSRGGHR